MARKAAKKDDGIPNWSVSGELALNCSCDVFCPCVVSLGAHSPTHGYCHAWIGVRVDDGRMGDTSLADTKVAMMLDIPGKMGHGNWTVALYIDEEASDAQFKALEKIFGGQARGTTGLFRLLVGNYLGAKRAPVTFTTEGDIRTIGAGKNILGQIQPIEGAEPGKPVSIENTSYWMGPSVIVARGLKSRVRDFGRVWDFDDCSAELCNIEWSGP